MKFTYYEELVQAIRWHAVFKPEELGGIPIEQIQEEIRICFAKQMGGRRIW